MVNEQKTLFSMNRQYINDEMLATCETDLQLAIKNHDWYTADAIRRVMKFLATQLVIKVQKEYEW